MRFLLPLIAGIVVQWYLQPPLEFLYAVFAFSIFFLTTTFFISESRKYRFRFIIGAAISMICLSLGCLLAWHKDIYHNSHWYGRFYQSSEYIVAVLKQPPLEKTNSYKALAQVTAVKQKSSLIETTGDLIIYLKKDSLAPPGNGARIIFSKPLQEIKNAGNPAGFDYKRYCLFQGITHQVYLAREEFIVLDSKPGLPDRVLYYLRDKVLAVLRTYIKQERERGLAEALLIGYKDDLDKNLVQSYSNTGVVHVIAISGLHLGLIYWLLVQLLKPLKRKKHFRWLVPTTIISGLWLFSLLAGAQPSVTRSALMFTCLVLGENLSRKTSIYNSLAVSAFVLLCVNPYWLWDVGFQLSYAAVLSIVIFMKPIHNWFYFENRLLDLSWKLNAVTISAQLLTTPFSIYHFHQFPNYFLFTNFIAVPLSSAIVLGEIFLVSISFMSFLATISGKIISWLLSAMNAYIEKVASLPGSLWGGMQITAIQAALLILIVAGSGIWLLERRKPGAWAAILGLLFFSALRSFSFCAVQGQQMVIVYNVPRHRAMDVFNGRNYFFVGDSDLRQNAFLPNFHIKPSRVLHRVHPAVKLPGFVMHDHFLQYGNRRILLADKDLIFDTITSTITVDILLISRNPKLSIKQLATTFNVKQVVFDGSNTSWKINHWTRDCESLHIPFHNVSEKGAFVMSLN